MRIVVVGNVETELSLSVSIALKKLLEGYTGDQEKVHLRCLSSYDSNYCLMNTPAACLREKKLAEFYQNFSIGFQNLLEGSTGYQEKLCLFSLSSYV